MVGRYIGIFSSPHRKDDKTAVVIELHRTERPGDTANYDHTARMRLDEADAAWVGLLSKGAGDTSISDDITAMAPLTLAQVTEVAEGLVAELEDWIDEAETGGEEPEPPSVNIIRTTLTFDE